MKKNSTFLVLILIIGLGYYVYQNTMTAESDKQDTMVFKPSVETNENLDDLPSETMPSTAVLEETNLVAVNDFTGSGTASRSYDNTFSHSVITNLVTPPSDKFYEGWLVTTTTPIDFFSTGKLITMDSGYGLDYSSNENWPDHNQVVITLETKSMGLDNKPELHVLEGVFASN